MNVVCHCMLQRLTLRGLRHTSAISGSVLFGFLGLLVLFHSDLLVLASDGITSL